MLVRRFSPLPVRAVLQGRGAVEELPRLCEQLGVRRALLVTGRSLSERTDVVARLRGLLGERLVGVYGRVSQHTPSGQVLEAAEEARRLEADGLISLGGGSPIDASKAIAYALSREIENREDLLGGSARSAARSTPPHIAIPTTLSAAECSYSAGVTDEQARAKMGVAAPDLGPTAVIYDPELTVPTPGWLWAATGMRAIDHAVESLYSPDHQPLTDTLAQEALRLLFGYLPVTSEWRVARGEWREVADEADQTGAEMSLDEALERRLVCQQAAWFSFYGTSSLRMGMSHALGRRIGARFDVPHGYTSAVTLPPVMRARLGEVPDRLRLVARAVGVDGSGLSDREAAERAAEAVSDLVVRLKLPTRLREVGIAESDLDWIADGRPETLELLREAW